MSTMDDDEKLISAFRELHAELLALGGDQGRETTYSRAADRLSALKAEVENIRFMWQVRDTCKRAEKAEAERDRMAAALRFYANEEVYKPHPSCLAFGAGITIDRGSVARAALSQEPTQ